MEEKFIACLKLGAVGDTIGFHNGRWEFMKDGKAIHKEFNQKFSFEEDLDLSGLLVSDDTILTIYLASALLEKPTSLKRVAQNLVEANHKMNGRFPGKCTQTNLFYIENVLETNSTFSNPIRPNEYHGGNGAAIRSLPLGLAFKEPEKIIKAAINQSKLTHNHPTGFLGSIVVGLFVHYALQDYPIATWPERFFQMIPFIENLMTPWEKERAHHFIRKWNRYITERDIIQPQWPEPWTPQERDEWYNSLSFDGWGGASGDDCTIIAYDNLLRCRGDWRMLVEGAVLHGGDNDSTGIVACGWYGAKYGWGNAKFCNLEFEHKIEHLSKELFAILTNKK